MSTGTEGAVDTEFNIDEFSVKVSITQEPVFSVGEPDVLFSGGYVTGNRPVWDISLDGQRFLLQKGQQVVEVESTVLVVVDNWFEELNRLAPPSP